MDDKVKGILEYIIADYETDRIKFTDDIKEATISAVNKNGGIITNTTDAAGRVFRYRGNSVVVTIWINGDEVTRITVVNKGNVQTLMCNMSGQKRLKVSFGEWDVRLGWCGLVPAFSNGDVLFWTRDEN